MLTNLNLEGEMAPTEQKSSGLVGREQTYPSSECLCRARKWLCYNCCQGECPLAVNTPLSGRGSHPAMVFFPRSEFQAGPSRSGKGRREARAHRCLPQEGDRCPQEGDRRPQEGHGHPQERGASRQTGSGDGVEVPLTSPLRGPRAGCTEARVRRCCY